MNKTSIDHKCPSCGANLEFNPQSQNWTCKYCDNKYTLEDLKKNKQKYLEKEVKEEKQSDNLDIYTCPNCSAQIITDLNTVATFCIYCKNTSIIKERLVGDFELKKILPFQNTKEDAVKAFEKLKKGHPLMPKCFADPKNISEIKGVYIPFWLFSTKVEGSLISNCEKVSSYRIGDYKYVTTKKYKVTREGNVSFEYVPNDGSKKFDDGIMNSIEPYDYTKLVDFSHSYLSGFYAEKYDLGANDAQKIIDYRIRNTVSDLLKDQIKGYSTKITQSEDIKYTDSKMEYVFLPVWFLNIKYKDNLYTFAMNGETGKLIGNIPVDKKKAWFVFFIVLISTFIICLLIFNLFIRSNV